MNKELIDSVSIGIASSGPLYEGSVSLLEKVGLNFSKLPRQLNVPSMFYENTFDEQLIAIIWISFMRPKDILRDVSAGNLELGIVGGDTIEELALPINRLGELGFGKCRLVVASSNRFVQSENKRVGTSYPNKAQEYYDRKGEKITIKVRDGAVEGMIPKLADEIVELVETGKSLNDNRLIEREEIGRYETELVSSPDLSIGSNRVLDCLISRLLGAKL